MNTLNESRLKVNPNALAHGRDVTVEHYAVPACDAAYHIEKISHIGAGMVQHLYQ